MQCNCIEELTEKIKQHATENKLFKKPILRATILGVGLTMDVGGNLDEITYSETEFELDGQKKKPKTKMFHAFCPFCGKRIRPEPAVSSSQLKKETS